MLCNLKSDLSLWMQIDPFLESPTSGLSWQVVLGTTFHSLESWKFLNVKSALPFRLLERYSAVNGISLDMEKLQICKSSFCCVSLPSLLHMKELSYYQPESVQIGTETSLKMSIELTRLSSIVINICAIWDLVNFTCYLLILSGNNPHNPSWRYLLAQWRWRLE